MNAVDHPFEVMRPFLWVAALAFSTGFLGYLGFTGHLAGV